LSDRVDVEPGGDIQLARGHDEDAELGDVRHGDVGIGDVNEAASSVVWLRMCLVAGDRKLDSSRRATMTQSVGVEEEQQRGGCRPAWPRRSSRG
jgi:hypothetical protein